MDVYQTPGAFSWCELLTSDAGSAKAFYTNLFGWGTREMPMPEGNYTSFQVGETAVGGLMKMSPAAAGMPPMWGVYVTVSNVDETIARVKQLGGKVLKAPWDVSGVGRMAVIQDPQGASLSVITYAMPSA